VSTRQRKKDSASDQLFEMLNKFESEYPHLSDAMRLFGMTMATYQRSLDAMGPPRTFSSNSTVITKEPLYYGNDMG
jgi:hypothetical protein